MTRVDLQVKAGMTLSVAFGAVEREVAQLPGFNSLATVPPNYLLTAKL